MWSHHMISSTDSKVRYEPLISDCGSKRVKVMLQCFKCFKCFLVVPFKKFEPEKSCCQSGKGVMRDA